MKEVKNLTVTVTYQVGFGELEIPEAVYEELVKRAERDKPFKIDDFPQNDAHDWLVSNIKEKFAFEWECKIDEID